MLFVFLKGLHFLRLKSKKYRVSFVSLGPVENGAVVDHREA